jgi:MoaA/NifB/PqqE/SkfB family radical SAM enzyme
MPFVHLNLKQEGRVCACWRSHSTLGNSNENSLTEIYNSDQARTLRLSLINGEKPEGCRSCWDMEAAGIQSTRLQTFENWKLVEKNIEFNNRRDTSNRDDLKSWILQNFDNSMKGHPQLLKSIEIRFDNICNLMCRHCSPVYSSLWESAVKKDQSMMEIMQDAGSLRTNETHLSLNNKIIDEIEYLAPHLQEILITGGEPLYHKKHYNFLKKIEPYAKNITLNYNSNFSTLNYNNQEVLPLWEKFKHVGVLVSIDATPEIYPYIRVNGDINKVEQNLALAKSLNNITVQATCTTSILNITRLIDVFKYFVSLEVGIHGSIVQWPTLLNPRVLPVELKEKTTEEFIYFLNNFDKEIAPYLKNEKQKEYYLNKITTVGNKLISYMNSKNMHNEQWNNTIHFIKTQDKFNNTNILDFYPEFGKYWK